MQIYPVIHHLNQDLSIAQARLAHDAGADGVFLISHHGQNNALPHTGSKIKDLLPPDFKIGVNFLGWDPVTAFGVAEMSGMDMLWLDAPGVSSSGLSAQGQHLVDHIRQHTDRDDDPLEIFASVAFKYQPPEPIPSAAAALARNLGFIPTTSGPATGVAPDVQKVADMFGQAGPLAVASGMTADNVAPFVPYLSHILVATGVSIDDHHFDFEQLCRFVGTAR